MAQQSNSGGGGGGRWVLAFIGLMVVFALLIVGVLVVVQRLMVQTAREALSPIEQANQGLRTQVAELLRPTPTIFVDSAAIIREVRSLARLETIQYTVEKVITAETNQNSFGFLFGDKLLFVAHGVVIAGVDMSKINPQDIRVEGDTVYVTLPPAEVFVATLDNEKSYVYDRETGILSGSQKDLETSARQAAEVEIRKAALEDGILDTAQLNAQNFLDRLLRDMGYSEVLIEISPVVTPTPP